MIYEFLDLKLDTNLVQLSRGKELIKLPKLSLNVLVTLLENAPQIITHDELAIKVWGKNRIITPENISQRIMILRKILNDDASNPKYIEGIHGEGYKIIPTVHISESQVTKKTLESQKTNNQDLIKSPNSTWKLAISIILTVIVMLFITSIINKNESNTTQNTLVQKDLSEKTNPQDKAVTLAVLPFVNMSADQEQEYFSDGITEEILNNLAQIKNLKVISRTSSFTFKNSTQSLLEIAEKLNVNHILEGSIRKDGNKIRITAQLIESKTDTHLWSKTYERELDNIFKIQDEISIAIATALKSHLNLQKSEIDTIHTNIPGVNLQAHNEYLRGKYFLEKRTSENLEKSLVYFEKAIDLSNNYAPAWAGKAQVNLFLSEFEYGNVVHGIAISNARVSAEKAFSLDPNLAEANAIMGLIEAYTEDREKSKQYFNKAIAINPNFADVYFWYSQLGDGKSLELIEKAVELNPLSVAINFGYGQLLRRTLQYDKAIKVAINMLDIDSDNHLAYKLLSNISYGQKNFAKGMFYHNKANQLNSSIPDMIVLYDQFNQYGLHQEALDLFLNTPFYEGVKSYLNADFVKANRLARDQIPRDKDDKYGAVHRAFNEMNVGNYENTVKYFEMSEWSPTYYPPIIYSYQQAGLIEKANEFINQRKIREQSLTSAGRNDIDVQIAETAYIENNTDKMAKHLKRAQDKDPDYILNHHYSHFPMFERLRQHPSWSLLISESLNRAEKVRNQYLVIKNADAETLAKSHTSTQSKRPKEIKVSPQILTDYVGVYVLTPTFSVTITHDLGNLYIQGTGQGKLKLAAESETLFFSLSTNDKFSFQKDVKGKVVSLIEHDKTFDQKYMKL